MSRSRRELLRCAGTGFATRGIFGHSHPVKNRQNRNFELEEGPPVALKRVVSGLTAPVQFAAPGTDYQYIVDQTGQIYVLSPDGLSDEPFLDVSDRMVNVGENLPEWVGHDERGLLGLAFHPDFPSDSRFYVRYSAPFVTSLDDSHTEVLAEYIARDDTTANQSSERILLAFPQHLPIHQGGTITFGPDDYLYISMGDGGWKGSAQDINNDLLGGILRIDVDGAENGNPYRIPRDNPLVDMDEPVRPEYFAWGFRNPWRISFYDGTLFAADVGESKYEEINIVKKGQNYGWPIKEGTNCFKTSSNENCREKSDFDAASVGGRTSFVDPVTQFPHAVGNEIIGRAIVGGYVYGKTELRNLQRMYIFGNYTHQYESAGSYIFASPVFSDKDLWPIKKLQIVNTPEFNRNVLSFGQDASGDIYVLTTQSPLSENPFAHNDGEVFRLVEPGNASPL